MRARAARAYRLQIRAPLSSPLSPPGVIPTPPLLVSLLAVGPASLVLGDRDLAKAQAEGPTGLSSLWEDAGLDASKRRSAALRALRLLDAATVLHSAVVPGAQSAHLVPGVAAPVAARAADIPAYAPCISKRSDYLRDYCAYHRKARSAARRMSSSSSSSSLLARPAASRQTLALALPFSSLPLSSRLCFLPAPAFLLSLPFSSTAQVSGLKDQLAAAQSSNNPKGAEKIAERLARNEAKLAAAEKRFRLVAAMINTDLKVRARGTLRRWAGCPPLRCVCAAGPLLVCFFFPSALAFCVLRCWRARAGTSRTT